MSLDHDFQKDLAWFKKFVHKFNGTSFFVKNSVDAEIHLDACLTGIGAVFKNFIYQAQIPDKFQAWHIAALEIVNIFVALKVWAADWSGKAIEIHCDNEVVVSVLKFGKTKDANLACISRNIFMIAGHFDIFLKVSHIQGKKNVIAGAQKIQLQQFLPKSNG